MYISSSLKFLMICCLFFLRVHTAIGQSNETQRIVTGIVIDNAGSAITNVSVKLKESLLEVKSNEKGFFSIKLPQGGGTLVFSHIGYQTQTFIITNQQSLRVQLAESLEALDEVVVVGYGTQKKENLTGAVASLKFDDIKNTPVANTTNMLQGRLPGVVLTGNGAQPGKDSPQIRIRGIGTLSDYNDPMVLIDGVESSVAQIADIPAADIDNISVLKDAASASIYGVRAANGVILITTKRGLNQKTQLTYNGSLAMQQATVLPDYVEAYDWAVMYNETHNNRVYSPDMLQQIKDGSDPDVFANTDWIHALFRNSGMQRHYLSANGGAEQTHYQISLQYFNQDGILKATGSETYNFRSNIDTEIGILKLGLNLSGAKREIDEPTTDVTGEGLMRRLTWFTRPTVPVQYTNGHYGYVDGSDISYTVFKNPVEELYRGYKDYGTNRFDGQAFAEVKILKNLKLRSSFAYKWYTENIATYNPRSSVYNAAGKVLAENENNSLSKSQLSNVTLINENTATYQFELNQHTFNFLAGHAIQEAKSHFDRWSIQGFITDDLYVIDAGTKNPGVSGYASENSLQSFFGRINYNYDNRYLLELNLRRDGSSRMPKNHRYGNFPSLSAGWNISNEQFMSSITWINSLKLRGSWGKLGNQEIGNYAYIPALAIGSNYIFDDAGTVSPGFYSANIANDLIRWETTTISDMGMDASFLQGKIAVTLDWFDKRTSDILLRLSLPHSMTGTAQLPYQNAGKVQNTGWEFATNYADNKGDFHWNVGLNFSTLKNKIIYNGGVDTYGSNTINREGNPIGSFYGLKALGLFRTTTDINRTIAVNGETKTITQYGTAPQLGDIMYADVNEDGDVNDNDRVIIGNPFPKIQYALNIGMGWKAFDLSAFFQGVGGIDRYNWEQTTLSNGGNMLTRWLDRYSSENQTGSMPKLGNAYNDSYSSFWLTSADYLRLKNLELGYSVSANSGSKWVKLGIQQFRVYVAGSNLVTFSSLKNFDPEKSSSDSRNDAHPNAKVYSIGINVKF